MSLRAVGFFLAVLCFVSAPAHAALTLVRDGKTQATLIVPQKAVEPAKGDTEAEKVHAAAAELQAYVEKLTGAKLPLAGDAVAPAGAAVLVGRSKPAEAMGAAIPSGLTPERKEEGFTIVCAGERLLLAGNDAGPYHGTEYAVYELLHKLGVRWYMPGPGGEVLPATRPTLTVEEMKETQRPDFILRNWWVNTTPELASLERQWKLRNKMNPDPAWVMPGDSSAREYVATPELTDEAKARLAGGAQDKGVCESDEPGRPIYFPRDLKNAALFALDDDGTVNVAMPNLSNPAAARVAADKMKALLKQRRAAGGAAPAAPGTWVETDSIGIAPDDGTPRDYRRASMKLNQGFVDYLGREGVPADMSVSEEWFAFVNAIAAEVKKDYPGVIITTNGYANRNLPPAGLKLDPNLSVMFAAIWADTLHAFDDPRSWQNIRQAELVKRWCALNPRVWIYGYAYTMITTGFAPVPTTRRIARTLPLLHGWGLAGFNDENRNQWMEDGIPTRYLRARLEWDAEADPAAILDEFYRLWYGGGAKPAHAFWDALDAAMEATPLQMHDDHLLVYAYTPELLASLKASIEEAERLADTETAKGHVRVDRLIYEHLRGYLAMYEAEWAGRFADAAAAAEGMMEQRKALHALSPFWVLPYEVKPDGSGLESGVISWGVLKRAEFYRKLADMAGGKTGDLVALLPEKAAFRADPTDDGLHEGWFLPPERAKETLVKPGLALAPPDQGWSELLTTRPFYLQAKGFLDEHGRTYAGHLWYRVEADVPAGFQGRSVHLYAPTVETEAWAWVNGEYVGHRPYIKAYRRPVPFDFDATAAIKPGQKNLIVVRVATNSVPAQQPAGLLSRMFLYAPK